MSCLFCKIVSGKVPSYKIYEDDHALAFLDITPVNLGHILVISKQHYKNMEDIPEDKLCNLMKVVKKVGRALKDGLKIGGYNINVNNNEVAGQIIPHLHFHIIPRYKNDGLKSWPQNKYEEGEISEIVQKIKSGFLDQN